MEDKIHIYFMPGLAASSKIFEHIKLPEKKYVLHYLEWIAPDSVKESLADYASKYVALIKHKQPILVGVSFGGILVQELSRLLKTRKVIIISSIKSRSEMPKRLRFLKNSKAYKFFPSRNYLRLMTFQNMIFIHILKKRQNYITNI